MTANYLFLLTILTIVGFSSTVDAFFPRTPTNSMTLTSSWVTTLQMSKAAQEKAEKKKRQQAMQAAAMKQGESKQASNFKESMEKAETKNE